MDIFSFDPEAHRYYLGGTPIPGVTEVLKQVVDYSMIPDAVLDRKRQIGSALHQCIEWDHRQELDEDSIDAAVWPYFEAWRKFKRECNLLSLVAAEQPVCSRTFRYGCIPDVWGYDDGGALTVIEVKSTAAVHPSFGLQTAAQARAIVESTLRPSQYTLALQRAQRFVLQLRPDRTYRLHRCAAADDFPTFLALLTVHRWKQTHNLSP